MDLKEKEKRRAILSDEEIIDLYWARNESAIEATDHKYRQYLCGIAYNIVHDRLDCEECLNDTYLGTWHRIPPTRPNAFQAFLSRIMRNIAIDRYRKNTAAKKVPSEIVTSLEELDESIAYQDSIEEEIAIRELSRILNDYLAGLTEQEAFVFICRYYYSDKIAKIAELTRVSERTVYRQLNELRKRLKETLDREGYCCE